MNNLTNSGNLILSEREVQILHYLKEGLTQKEISEKVFLSLRGLEDVLEKLRLKTGCEKTRLLPKWAEDNGYLNQKAA